MNRYIFLSLIVAIAISGSCTSEISEKKAEKPNVIIIVSDDQGWGDAGFNGATDIRTPELDDLASNGIVFTSAYASHPYCSPSRAGILTGRYQHRFGHENNTPYSQEDPDAGLPLNENLIAEVLKENGYNTCAIGKWHLGDNQKFWPNNNGFDYWFGFFGGGMSYWGDTGNKSAEHGVLRNGVPVPQKELTYLTDDFTDEAVQYIDNNTDAPFFMYLAYNAPHMPLHSTKEYLNKTDYIEEGERSAYSALVVGMDEGIGNVMDALERQNQLDNTLIFFLSDNGGHIHGASSAPFRGHKGMLFEGGIRVPFLMSWGKNVPKGMVYNQPIIALDIFPTILDAIGVEVDFEEKIDGVSLLPFVNGENSNSPHNELFWRYSDGAGYAVRQGDYKMVMSGYKQKHFLFNLSNDPYEQNDLSEQNPEKLKELIDLYQSWSKGTIPALWHDPHPENILIEEKARQAIRDKASAGEK